jgi:tetratricopeptide (TPR) repeat protein
MPIDFGKLSSSKPAKRPIDPIELFQSLMGNIRDPNINDLWLAQGDALRVWHSKRTCEDLAIVLNTGAGKTLVGLLAAQSIVNETNEHVLYVCSSIQLVEQTVAKATGYGLEVTTYLRSEYSNTLYQRCLAPCITTYQAIFNGKSRFLRDNKAKAIIFDDAHTSEHLLRDSFTLCIKHEKFPILFSQIVELFRNYHCQVSRGVGYEETNQNQDPNKHWFVPPFALYEQHNELQRYLLSAKLNETRDTMFSWEYLKDRIDLCTIFISGKEVSITPPIVPIKALPYFKKGIRRLYLSAPLAASDKFLRTFGKIPELIAPETRAGECERLILIPSLNKQCKNDVKVAKEIIADKKALILVPSYGRQNEWLDVVTKQEADDVTDKIENFKNSKSPDKLLLVSRYDGVDLPGDTCRVMVIDQLPSGLNPLERYLWEQLNLVKILRSAIASRVVQGFGRISRGMSDYGVVILTDRKLKDWLLDPSNQAALPPFLRRQLELGRELSEQEDSLDNLVDSASQCLDRDPGWTQHYRKYMAQSNSHDKPTNDEEALEIAQIEVEFGNFLWLRKYQEAAKSLEQSLEGTFTISDKTGAWHLLWLGYCYQRLGKNNEAFEAYQRAHNIESNIPPIHIPGLSESDQQLPPQVVAVARYLHRGGAQMRHEMPKRFDSDLTALNGTAKSAPTEAALCALGRYLGLTATRPDHEFRTGPDVLWDTLGGPALNLEVKSEKTGSCYQKDELGQLRDHIQWVRDRSESSEIYSAFVGPLLPPSQSANPDSEIMVIELSEFKTIAERLRAALQDICTQALPTALPQVVFDVFKQRDLLWPELYERINKYKLRNITGV